MQIVDCYIYKRILNVGSRYQLETFEDVISASRSSLSNSFRIIHSTGTAIKM